MTPYVERHSPHQYVEAVWHKTANGSNYWVPADGCWDIIFAKQSGERRRVFIAGPMTKARLTCHAAYTELVGVRFRPGVYMPQLLPSTMVDRNVDMQHGSNCSFLWLEGVQYEVPTHFKSP